MVDRRRVQTAVMGETADSDRAVFLPMDRQEAEEYRRQNAGAKYWCGTYQLGCGRPLGIRTPEDKVAHFYHLSSSPKQRPCQRFAHTRGRRDNDPVIALAALRPWRQSRGLPEETVEVFDSRRGTDARYLLIVGPRGSRHTCVVVGDVSSEELSHKARSSQARDWDWFVHYKNNVVRFQLEKNGISYGVIRFVDHGDTVVMQVDTAHGWAPVEYYVPAPNGPRPEPPKPPAPRTPRPTVVSPEPRAPRTRHRLVLEPAQLPAPPPQPAPEKDPHEEQLEQAQWRLEDALILGGHKDVQSAARDLRRLWAACEGKLAPMKEHRVKDLLGQAGLKW